MQPESSLPLEALFKKLWYKINQAMILKFYIKKLQLTLYFVGRIQRDHLTNSLSYKIIQKICPACHLVMFLHVTIM